MLDVAPVSTLSWLDFSEHERRKALDVIDMYRDRGTVDELGLGTIRDAIANIFFPGTSTIQTRARYFFFIPWIYQRLERRENNASDAGRAARFAELQLVSALQKGGEAEGVIGIEAKGALKRLPSSVYWQGLAVWGMRVGSASQAEYHRGFARYMRSARRSAADDELDASSPQNLWHPNLPAPPDDFPDIATFKLRREESEYIRERLLQRVQHSLLCHLVDQCGKTADVAYPWEHPDHARFPERNANELEHARLFALAMHGAAIAYNLLLSELVNRDDLVASYEDRAAAWGEEVQDQHSKLRDWNRTEFWTLVRRENPRIGLLTHQFVESWMSLLLAAPAPIHELCKRADARNLISLREHNLKRGLARIYSPEARSRWNGSSGASRLDFRWFRTQGIVNDILEGADA